MKVVSKNTDLSIYRSEIHNGDKNFIDICIEKSTATFKKINIINFLESLKSITKIKIDVGFFANTCDCREVDCTREICAEYIDSHNFNIFLRINTKEPEFKIKLNLKEIAEIKEYIQKEL